MAQTKKVIAGGFAQLQYARVSTAGYPDGASLTAGIAAGGDDGLGRLNGVKTASITLPEAERPTQTGDDEAQGSLIFASPEVPSGQMTTGIFDQEFDALAVGHLVYAMNDGTSIDPIGGSGKDYRDMMLILSRQAKSKDAATSGRKRKEHYLLPSVNVDPQGGDGFTERAFSDGQYSLTCNPAAKFPWGLALGAANVGTTAAPVLRFFTDYNISLHTVVGDGTVTSFTLDHAPASDHTGNYFDLFNFATGLDASSLIDSVNTTTGVVTLTGALGSGTTLVAYYQYE